MAYDSKFEEAYGRTLGPEWVHHGLKLTYQPKPKQYEVDWINHATKEIYEAKGYWDNADRQKILLVSQQHPNYKIIMIFQNPSNKISKNSNTTYSDWCEKHGIEWRHFTPPKKGKNAKS